MAANSSEVSAAGEAAPVRHQRHKSSVLRSFMLHRRINNLDGETPAVTVTPLTKDTRGPGPLEEKSHNRQQDLAAGPYLQIEKRVNAGHDRIPRGAAAVSPTKKMSLTVDTQGSPASSENRPIPSPSPKKTNFAGLLSRPKSFKNLQKQTQKETEQADHAERSGLSVLSGHKAGGNYKKDKARAVKDKENCTPPGSVTGAASADPPPIYAQFCSSNATAAANGTTNGEAGTLLSDHNAGRRIHSRKPSLEQLSSRERQHTSGTRPKSFHPASTSSSTPSAEAHGPVIDPKDIDTHLEALLDRRNIPEHQRYKMRSLAAAIKMEFIRQDWAESQAKRPRSHDSVHSPVTSAAVSGAACPPTAVASPMTSDSSADTADKSSKAGKSSKSKHSRVKSLTLSRVTRGRSRDRDRDRDRDRGDGDNTGGATHRHKSPGLSLRIKAEGTLARHLRSKSTESIRRAAGADPADSAASVAGTSGGNALLDLFNKAKGPQQQTPGDFVQYLRTIQKPELVEVGKLHKLRLLLRNETVAWTEEFIGQGGMEETVGLLHRILAIEWREEHEDALLHENLLCLKALCTTALALQYLHANQASLLPALIHMIFDPEKKGPSEFTTRNIVTWLLFTYIQSASLPDERAARASTVLGYLRDPEGSRDSRTLSFVLEMRRERPYRVWCKEVVNVTKEVFWIFLHHLNVISLPAAARAQNLACSDKRGVLADSAEAESDSCSDADESPPPPPSHTIAPQSSYMYRHFPKERPPVPAAPYIGGVEWEATNYLASHLDLVNAILACTPSAAERKRLREQMQMSGWERCMGGSLRLCKEKFYGAVHDGLRTWVAAAHEDGWDVRDVRYGPAPPAPVASTDQQSDVKKSKSPAAGGLLADTPAPKIEIPKLDFVLDTEDL